MGMIPTSKILSLASRRILSCPFREPAFVLGGSCETKRLSTMSANQAQSAQKSITKNGKMSPIQVQIQSNTSQRRTHSTTISAKPTAPSPNSTRAFIALGSNVGDRVGMIEKACELLNNDPNIVVRRTSCLYETEPMYVEDQSRFVNGACEVC